VFKDILVRSLAALVVFGCGVYFAFGVAVGAAAYQQGTAIRHDEPVTFSMLLQEAVSVRLSAVLRWFTPSDGCGAFFLGSLSLWFLAAFSVAFTLAVEPRIFVRSRRVLVFAAMVLGLGTLLGAVGLRNLKYTFLNAFVWRGLDGEWVIELGPVLDAVGLLYLFACLLFVRSWFLWLRGSRESLADLGPAQKE
jgi:hypothetical protein